MYETLKRTLFTNGDVKKNLSEGEKRQLGFKNLYLLASESQFHPGGQLTRKRLSVLRGLNAWIEVSSVVLRLQMWQAAGRVQRRVCGWKREGGAERRQVGWSVEASDWCALSYVGINHDSEMTYFLTPQTNSTFNRSQGLCQTAFSPCSLSKVASSRIGLLRHNAEDGRFHPRHHLLLYCNLH